MLEGVAQRTLYLGLKLLNQGCGIGQLANLYDYHKRYS